ncbi:MAG TPA: hypothetical protein VFE47_29845 [Tepidisphaeraceae bacterium]|jgi:hypothetical protein|nr:hypothetical protein [Tepidisphaeraceae bacterium]
MKSIATGNPDRIAFRQPLGWGAIISIPFLLVVVAFTLFCWFSPHMGLLHPLPHGTAGTLILVGLAAFSFLSFLSFARGYMRIGTVIDRSAGTVECRSGWMFPIGGQLQSLRFFSQLRIGTITVRQRRADELFYVLDLIATDGGPPARIGRSTNYPPVRDMAEKVGSFLAMPIVDMTASTPVTIIPGTAQPIDQPGAPAATSAQLKACVASAPAGRRLLYALIGDRLLINISPSHPWVKLTIIALLWLGAAGGLIYLHAVHIFPWGLVAVYGAPAAFILLVLGSVVWPEWLSIEADRTGIKVKRSGVFLASRKQLARGQIREIRYDKGFHAFEIIAQGRIIRCQCLSLRAAGVQWTALAIRTAIGMVPEPL